MSEREQVALGNGFPNLPADALTHCDTCGCPFGNPVTVEEAREHFAGDLSVAAYSCGDCAQREWEADRG